METSDLSGGHGSRPAPSGEARGGVVGRPRGTKNGRPITERIDRFVDVDPASGCRLWTGSTSHGYALMTLSAQKKGLVHRVVWELHHGSIPDELTVDHKCHRPACVNVSHLQLMSRADNTRTAPGTVAKASRESCVHGHPYDEPNTYRAKNGTRKCDTCRRRVRPWNILPKQAPYVPDASRHSACAFEHRAVEVLGLLKDGSRTTESLRRELSISVDEAIEVLAWLARGGFGKQMDANVWSLSSSGEELLS